MKTIQKLKELCDGIEYSRNIPQEAKQLAKEEGYIIIVGGSDDLMYVYGADCYMTEERELPYGWDGDDLTDIDDKKLEKEASQLGLMIYWCGSIDRSDHVIVGYDVNKSGAFSYTVNDDIESEDFIVNETFEEGSDVYCTGKIIKLPEGFERA